MLVVFITFLLCQYLSGLRKPVFFVFFYARFCAFFKKTAKPHSELFLLHHAISLFSEIHNNNLYLLWPSKLRIKECTPSLIWQRVVGQFTPKWLGLGKHSHSREKPPPHKLSTFTSSLCACPVISASVEYIFSKCDLAWSKIRKCLDLKKSEKLLK